MKNYFLKLSVAASLLFSVIFVIARAPAEEPAASSEGAVASDAGMAVDPASETIPVTSDSSASEKMKEEPAIEEVAAPVKPTRTPKRIDAADAFVAGPGWEFDGFVAGGQDSEIRTMFYLNDLIYVNIGSQQGVEVGEKVAIYKRGDRVRDPQTGKFLGYEVRRAAFARATERVEDNTSALRITNTKEAVQIGDLVRLEK